MNSSNINRKPADSYLFLICFTILIVLNHSSLAHNTLKADEKLVYFAGDCSKLSLEIPLNSDSDLDSDRISDVCEQTLAEKFAPIVYHSSDESNFPTNVDWFLSKTNLRFFSIAKSELNRKIIEKPTQMDLLNQKVEIAGTPPVTIASNGTRSERKKTGFYLEDVAEEFRKGSMNSCDWITYFNAYPNDKQGITIQYWRFYAYNDAANNHGGDWEGIHITLDENLRSIQVGLLGHTNIEYKSFTDMQKEGDHVRVFSEGGGHGTRASGDGIQAKNCGGIIGGSLGSLICHIDLNKQATFVRQETWTNGTVVWFDNKKDRSGKLLNIGAKTKPMNEQVFIQYSGLWGSPSEFFGSPTYFSFSGYWGPAFNETGMRDNKFITAWCDGIKNPSPKECFADTTIQ